MSWNDPLYFSQTKTAAKGESLAGRHHGDVGGSPVHGTPGGAQPRPTNDSSLPSARPASPSLIETGLPHRGRDNAEMDIEQLEQLAAVIVTAGLVAGNFLLFTPWRDGQDPRRSQPESLILKPPGRHRLIGLDPNFNPEVGSVTNSGGKQSRRFIN